MIENLRIWQSCYIRLPSKAFCALSLSFGFLSGWTNIDNYEKNKSNITIWY